MALYKYLREAWDNGELLKERLIQWRDEPVTVRLRRPTRLDRARSLGYKAKPGFIIVRQRVQRSRRMHPRRMMGGRRPKTSSQRKDLNKRYGQIAEERASRKYLNCEVLNSYYLAEDGRHFWYEVILVDKASPSILADKNISWIANEKGRAFRGLTSSGRAARGLRNRGKGGEKVRPSKTANIKRRM
ncbi:50S ribosomal protein L15e [Candidatus Woesearchaeota archaeon]|nr:50S ribosomal protein L15e [Candidatus Woesearchaeota archaeon]